MVFILCTLATDTSLSYCWKLKTNVHHPGAIGQTNVTNETECQRRCIDNCNCTGVDWNEVPYNRTKCWMLLSHATRTPKNYSRKINHWTIVRTVPRNCYGKCFVFRQLSLIVRHRLSISLKNINIRQTKLLCFIVF